MSWDYLVWFVIGAICAVRLPILPFTLVVVVGIACYAFTLIGSGNPATTITLWCLFYAASLQAGYFFTHFLLYLIYVKIGGRDRKRRPNADDVPDQEFRHASHTSPKTRR